MAPCVQCGKEALYKCPRCLRATCSLDCSRAHKTQYDCSGVQDPLWRQRLSADKLYTWGGLMRDASYLNDIGRTVQSFGKTLSADLEPSNTHPLVKDASREGARLVLMPEEMSKRKSNESHWDDASGGMLWDVDVLVFDYNKVPSRRHMQMKSSQLLRDLPEIFSLEQKNEMQDDPVDGMKHESGTTDIAVDEKKSDAIMTDQATGIENSATNTVEKEDEDEKMTTHPPMDEPGNPEDLNNAKEAPTSEASNSETSDTSDSSEVSDTSSSQDSSSASSSSSSSEAESDSDSGSGSAEHDADKSSSRGEFFLRASFRTLKEHVILIERHQSDDHRIHVRHVGPDHSLREALQGLVVLEHPVVHVIPRSLAAERITAGSLFVEPWRTQQKRPGGPFRGRGRGKRGRW